MSTAVAERKGDQKVICLLSVAWIEWWVMMAVELSECGLKMWKPGGGLKVRLRSWSRPSLILRSWICILNSCCVWFCVQCFVIVSGVFIVDPVLYCRIRVTVQCGVVMIIWGVRGRFGEEREGGGERERD